MPRFVLIAKRAYPFDTVEEADMFATEHEWLEDGVIVEEGAVGVGTVTKEDGTQFAFPVPPPPGTPNGLGEIVIYPTVGQPSVKPVLGWEAKYLQEILEARLKNQN